MITFEEAKVQHGALLYDSVYTPRGRLTAPIAEIASALDQAIELLGKAEIIVFPWEHAMPFQRQWSRISVIKSVKDAPYPWLWGYFVTYRGIDCLASSLTQVIVVSGVRDLRESYGPEDRVVLINVAPPGVTNG
jgi:hypothetical protein